ncbi:MAG: DNA-(apurinic or apyrimidinic site) lyase / endonuclease [Phycisphaerales bacterium]|nr:DNA-(apurinic or apyrimidinic site) lyase / endonuclease [Phycisphaerales bacterium]
MPRAPSRKTLDRQQRVAAILPILKRTYPQAKCSLDHCTPLELLVATILSAQSTDERVNIVTKDLFKKYRSPGDYATVPQEQLEKDIHSTGFYRNKAKSIRGMAAALLEKHGGKVPQTMEELIDLPGVGRKTANVVLGNAFDLNVGITVDTHVTRLANRLGLTSHTTDAVRIEQDLIPLVPQKDWALWSHLLIHHGRAICTARNPQCEKCPIFDYCPSGPKFIAERAKKEAAR